jgi:hypothetical protein
MKISLQRTVVASFAICVAGCSGSSPEESRTGVAQSAVTGCIDFPSTTGWYSQPMETQTGTFQFAFDATPTLPNIDALVGLSNGLQTSATAFAALVRFNSSGNIDALSGKSFKAANAIPYSPNVTYHFVLVVDISTHKYSAFVSWAGGAPWIVGTRLSFGSGARTVTSLDAYGEYDPTSGAFLDVCNPTPSSDAGDFSLSFASTAATTVQGQNSGYQAIATSVGGFADSVTLFAYALPTGALAFTYPPEPVLGGSGILNVNVEPGLETPPGTYRITLKAKSGITGIHHSASGTLTVTPAVCSTATPTDGWTNNSLPSLTAPIALYYDVMTTAEPTTSYIGTSSGPQTSRTGFATLVRFNSSGTIDAIDGSTYQAVETLTYKANTTYHVLQSVDPTTHTYSVLVEPAGQPRVTIATNFAFQTGQSNVTQLDNWGVEMSSSASGQTKVCNFALPEE